MKADAMAVPTACRVSLLRFRRPGLPPPTASARLVHAAGVAVGCLSLFALWAVLSVYVRPWVPTPADTFAAIGRNLRSPVFYDHLAITLFRVMASFAAATIIGSALGIFIGLNRKAEAFFQPLLAIALAVPDPVYIIFAILAVGTGETAGFVALTIAVSPFVTNIVRTSVQARDTGLDEMARVYRLPPRRAFWETLVPQLVPALLTAARFSFALSWKLVVVVEAIGQPDGIGAQIHRAFSLLRMREVAALAILFILLMQVLERGVLGRIEKRLLRWRR